MSKREDFHFLDIFLILIYVLILLWLKNIFNDLSPGKLIEDCFTAQQMVYLNELTRP